MVSLPLLFLACLLTHIFTVGESLGWHTGKARDLAVRQNWAFLPRTLASSEAKGTDLGSYALLFPFIKWGHVELHDLLYTKLWPRVNHKQGLEEQVSKTDSTLPSGCSRMVA